MSEFVQIGFIRELKEEILRSRYKAAKVANSELLKLYFRVGKALDQKIEQEKWGAKVLDAISAQLQQELPGLKGFSTGNLRKMRLFYQSWKDDDLICPSLTDKLETGSINKNISEKLGKYLSISFTHHYEIILKASTNTDRWFYIQKSAQSFWSVRQLKNELKSQSHLTSGTLPNNFDRTLEAPLSKKPFKASKMNTYLIL